MSQKIHVSSHHPSSSLALTYFYLWWFWVACLENKQVTVSDAFIFPNSRTLSGSRQETQVFKIISSRACLTVEKGLRAVLLTSGDPSIPRSYQGTRKLFRSLKDMFTRIAQNYLGTS